MQMVERLIEAGANVQLVDVRGYTALQCAAEGGHIGPFRNLLQAGCDPMAQDHAGVSVLHSACQGGCLEIINHLQSLGADPSDRTLQGRDCLHYAALGKTPHLHLLTYQPLHFKAATLF
jgi:ankyrin repeat protein